MRFDLKFKICNLKLIFMSCVFCKIVNKEIPSEIIYENDKIMAFLDISPVNKGHTLVVTKEHYENSLVTPEEILRELIVAAKKVALAVKEATGADGINLGINNGKAAGQVIFHAHWHVIPRFLNDGYKMWGSKEYASKKEQAEIAEKIRQQL